ncbi:MAG: LysR family transcriptional regulator [Myxococcota bacterium]
MGALDGLEVFVAVCDAGSIAGAGRALGVPRATLSRQLSRLEEELGVILLHRTTRRLVRTAAGEELYGRVRHVVAEATAAREAIRRQDDVPRGILRVTVAPNLGGAMRAVFFEYLDRYPDVRVEMVASARHVDLVGEGFDLALRAGRITDPNLVVRRLARIPLRVFGSQSYLAKHGTPKSPSDLMRHNCILGFTGEGVPANRWPLLAGGTVQVDGRMSVNLMGTVIEAVVAGRGLALIPDLKEMGTFEGPLTPVLRDSVGTTADLSVVIAERAHMLPRVRAFIDLVVERMPSILQAGIRG